MSDRLEWMRRNYGIPARRGMRVVYDGKPATIVGGGTHLRLRIDGERRIVHGHPTYRIVYPQIPEPPRPRGWCSWCTQDRAMTKDGLMGKHRPGFPTNEDCAGTGKPPMWPVVNQTHPGEQRPER